MCGIAGFWDTATITKKPESVLRNMANAIRYRGPDDFGVWHDPTTGIGLAHQRLSIQDLSELGHQPMTSQSGRYTIIFNGEIYNFISLRTGLEKIGYKFHGHSDTEVILALIEERGIEDSLRAMVGMFAIALWDKFADKLYLIRDRYGEKPLYYGVCEGVLLFSSELKAIRAHPCFNSDIDRDVLSTYLRFNYIPTPYCIYKGFRKAVPGTYLVFYAGNFSQPECVSYWTVFDDANSPRDSFSGDDHEAIDKLEQVLLDTISDKMIADVPLGAFLSGGVDSSTIVALMQKQSRRKVRTFSIGFHEDAYNEAHYAKEVASYLNTEHTELYVTPEMAQSVIPDLPLIYDEPFADVSQIPTYLVSQLARQHVTVSLSGDGGDELFGGYTRYSWATSIWRAMRYVPLPFRRAAQALISGVSVERWNSVASLISPLTPSQFKHSHPGDKLHKLAGVLSSTSGVDVYRYLVSQSKSPDLLVKGGRELPTALNDPSAWGASLDFSEQMMLMDQLSYLRDDILTKVDRAAMAVSLETRVPFLDHRVTQLAWRLPLSLKVRDGKGKWILRQVLYKYVPEKLIERPKTGFGVPIAEWLRRDLREWAESLLSPEALSVSDCWNIDVVRGKWIEHVTGRRNWWYEIWGVLMFQAWRFSIDDRFVTGAKSFKKEVEANT
ncbi:asparagine synthase (glutamine-hydrolyzing) [Hahella chejuensis KCTC 2396]|uniref:asparagine synthase (glutamine-hydrolyzing) n=1 Tax=Hahella chejuensis (strain KCTC 2396) TaxID=349521 RepID=Q2SJG4_HAHCH|nr:asparagine synthase (glutamine-hydrolyzing) [Hahella chejuensis]ABC29210.1 asparagine synthase (glutamine-hydrolyzing) [Hahella chejuensis KCTC 2396]